MTILAWVIIGCFLSFGVLPGLFDENCKDYKSAWVTSHAVVLVVAALGTVGAAIMWAATHLVNVYF